MKNGKMIANMNKLADNETLFLAIFPEGEADKFGDILSLEDKFCYSAYATNTANNPSAAYKFSIISDNSMGQCLPECYKDYFFCIIVLEEQNCEIDMKRILQERGVDYRVLIVGRHDGGTLRLNIEDHINNIMTKSLFQEHNTDKFADTSRAFMRAICIANIMRDEDVNNCIASQKENVGLVEPEVAPYVMSEDEIKSIAKKVQDSFDVMVDFCGTSLIWKAIDYNPDYLALLAKQELDSFFMVTKCDFDQCLSLINIPAIVLYNDDREDVMNNISIRVTKCYGEKLFELGKIDEFLAKGSAA